VVPAEELEIPAAAPRSSAGVVPSPEWASTARVAEDRVVQQAIGFAPRPPALLRDLLSRLGLGHGFQRLLGGGEAPASQHVRDRATHV